MPPLYQDISYRTRDAVSQEADRSLSDPSTNASVRTGVQVVPY